MTKKRSCRAPLRADLKAFADGELSPFARFRVARHLRLCPSCQEELIQMQTLSTELEESDGQAEPLAPELRAHILDSVPTPEQLEDEVERKRQRRVARKKMVLAVGLCSLVGLVFLTAYQQSGIIEGGGRDSGGFIGANPPVTDTASNASGASSSTLRTESHSHSTIVGGPGVNSATFADGHLKAPSDGLGSAAADRASAKSSTFQNQNAVINSGPTSIGDNAQGGFKNGNQPLVVPDETTFSTSITTTNANPSFLPPSRVVHREGSLSVAVPNAETASENATAIIKNAGGFVANTSLETGANQKRTAVLDCRVPVAQFEIVVSKIGALGKVRAKSLSGQDITAQVARSGARRQTLSQELSIAQARLEQREKSRKKADTYELRAEVRTLRIQASQARAQLEALQKYGSLSSLYVSLQDTSPAPTPKTTSWFDSLSPSSQAAWSAFLSNARVPLQLVLWILAYSPIWLPLLLVWRKFGRKWLME